MGEAMRPFVAVDIETTGLDPQYHEVIEVGLVLQGGQEIQFSLPFDESKADPRALEVNGWGKRQFAPLVGPSQAVTILESYLEGVHLVGKNPQFDAGFLEAFPNKQRGFRSKPPWHHRLVDVGSLAWGYDLAICSDNDRHLQPPNVEQVANMMKMPIGKEEAHTALGDARWVYKVFNEILHG